MLVGNKLDMESSRRTPREMGERFAQEEGLLFTEASAKNGDGVQDLFMEIGKSLSSFFFTATANLVSFSKEITACTSPATSFNSCRRKGAQSVRRA